MQAKKKDYSKKATGHHKIYPTSKNRKKGVAPKSISSNTMQPRSSVNRADHDLGKLLGR